VLSTAAQALRRTTTSDAHPLVRVAASLTYADVVAGRPPESFNWLAELAVATTSHVQPQRGTPQPTTHTLVTSGTIK
jgi:hypothetical protein